MVDAMAKLQPSIPRPSAPLPEPDQQIDPAVTGGEPLSGSGFEPEEPEPGFEEER